MKKLRPNQCEGEGLEAVLASGVIPTPEPSILERSGATSSSAAHHRVSEAQRTSRRGGAQSEEWAGPRGLQDRGTFICSLSRTGVAPGFRQG